MPERIPVRALIDTGASVTVLDTAIVRKLSLMATGTISFQTPSTGETPHVSNQYDVSILLVSPIAKRATGFDNIPVIEADLSAQGLQALLGRDILRQCLFVYDGVAGLFSLAF
ncbi:MAG: retroviral-like aspartic protease family protein [Planctomycetes bacterium]|nr:retroviral-like aspartic protease family protein [Planctomycetota bacterium]